MEHIRRSKWLAGTALKFLKSRYLKSTNIFNVCWFVSWRCNASCTFCNLGNRQEERPELTTHQGIKLIAALSDEGAGRASLVGGEPLLREDLPLLIKEFRTKRIKVSITTNGLMLRDDVIAARPDEINLSIDFPDERHDALRNVQGAYRKAREALDYYSENQGRYSYKLGINIVLSKANINSLQGIIDIGRQKKVSKITLQPLLEPQMRDKECSALLFFSESELPEVRRLLKDIKKNNRDIFTTSAFFLNQIPLYLKGPGFHRMFCFAGGTFVNISANGDIMPCLFMKPAGNVQDEPLGKILNSYKFSKLHERAAKRDCRDCLCPDIHEPNMIFSPLYWIEAVQRGFSL